MGLFPKPKPRWFWKTELKENGIIEADLTKASVGPSVQGQEQFAEQVIEQAIARQFAPPDAARLSDDQEWIRQQTVRGDAEEIVLPVKPIITRDRRSNQALTSSDPRLGYATQAGGPFFRPDPRNWTTGPLTYTAEFSWDRTALPDPPEPPKPPEPVEPVQWEFKRQIKLEDE